MAGHSKWANIKRTKEAQDKKRASVFTKLSKDITVTVKLGESGDPGFNPMLKVAIDKAKAANMPNDKIQKAIDKGLGISDTDDATFENTYEFYGPNGTAFIVDCETDNPNRVVIELKVIANKLGLKMASEGSISWQFKEQGMILINVPEDNDIDEIVLELLEIEGIIDVEKNDEYRKIIISTEKIDLKRIFDSIKGKFPNIEVEKAELIKATENMIEIDSETEKRTEEIREAFEENADISNIWTNF